MHPAGRRLRRGETIVLASHNPGKLAEAGVTVAVEPAVLAVYWSRPDSLTRNGAEMIRNHRTVMARTRRITDVPDVELDRRQRDFDAAQLHDLSELAAIIVGELELRLAARRAVLTR